MARIIGGVATSHTPTIGFAYDQDKQDDPDWAPIFKAFEPVSAWFREKQPDAIVYIFNDHVTSFFFDHYSAFTLGIGEEFPVADEGGGARELPPVPGNPKLAAHIAQSLVTDEFDLSYFQDKPLDHGFFSPMSVLLDHRNGRWPTTIVPLQIGVLQFPIPTAARCYKMGKALRRAIESYPEDITVAIVSTGGLSHQVHGERAGFNNPEWDAEFLERFTDDPASLLEMTHAEYAELGGFEGAEVIMWLMMRGALSDNVDLVSSSYYLPSMTGIATLVLDDKGGKTPESVRERHRERMALQLKDAVRALRHVPLRHRRERQGVPDQQVPARHDRPRSPRAIPRRPGDLVQAGRPDRGGEGPHQEPRLAGDDPLRRDLLHAGEARRRQRRLQPARVRGHAGRDARGVPQDAQHPGDLLGRGERRREEPRRDRARRALRKLRVEPGPFDKKDFDLERTLACSRILEHLRERTTGAWRA